MKKRYKLKKKFIIFLSIYFVFLTSYLSVLTLSKYAGKIEKSGSISVAKWDVTAAIPNGNVNVVAGNTIDTYTLTVTSESEIATNYSIVLSSLPMGVQVALDNGSFKGVSSGKIQFNNVGTFNTNSTTKTKTHILKVKAELFTDETSNKNIKVDVVFTQKKLN